MDLLTDNIVVSVNGRALLAEKDSTDDAKVHVMMSMLATDVFNPDNQIIAGRICAYRAAKSCQHLQGFLDVAGHLLSDMFKSFCVKHMAVLDKTLAEEFPWNFVTQDYFSANTLVQSYLLRPFVDMPPCEGPIMKNLRIAIQLYGPDDDIDAVIKAFKDMNRGYYTHASPTIFNSGTKRPQLASCFLLEAADTLDGFIREPVGDMATISACNGAVGIVMSKCRHSSIGYNGKAGGVIPVGRVYDRTLECVDQGGKRKGAGTAFLDVSHVDLWEFIKATDNFGSHDVKYNSLFTCVWGRDLFFHRCSIDGDWTVFCPATVPGLFDLYGPDFEKEYLRLESLAHTREVEYTEAVKMRESLVAGSPEYMTAVIQEIKARKARIVFKTYKAQKILDHIVDIQGKSGTPFVMNGDTCNYKSNQKSLGPIGGSNLCIEIVEKSSPDKIASCNLASVNLSLFAKKYVSIPDDSTEEATAAILRDGFDFQGLAETMRNVVNNLEKVIDHNLYPLDKIRVPNMENRPLGIGVSGLDDAFKAMDLVHGSIASRILNRMIFACMYYNFLETSADLADIHGPYPSFREGSFKRFMRLDDKKEPMFATCHGSPVSNGQLQFDLWKEEAEMLSLTGRLNHEVYDRSKDEPIPPSWWGSTGTWEAIRERASKGIRHSLGIALMPTATTAQMLRNAESTEAHQALIYSRRVMSGTYVLINRHLVKDLQDIGLMIPNVVNFIIANEGSAQGLSTFVANEYPKQWTSRLDFLEEKYKTMFEIGGITTMTMARERAIYVCQSQSLNIYVRDPTQAQKRAITMLGSMLRLKTITYYLRQLPTVSITGFNIPVSIKKYMRETRTAVTRSMVCRIGKTDAGEDCLACQ